MYIYKGVDNEELELDGSVSLLQTEHFPAYRFIIIHIKYSGYEYTNFFFRQYTFNDIHKHQVKGQLTHLFVCFFLCYLQQ